MGEILYKILCNVLGVAWGLLYHIPVRFINSSVRSKRPSQ